MEQVLSFIPTTAKLQVEELLEATPIEIKITPKRLTKHGDFRRQANGTSLITLNATPNPYRFLITLLHELAHFKVSQQFSLRVKPHGPEWKTVYRKILVPFLNPEIFPSELLPVLARHFKSPKASSSSDASLDRALAKYDQSDDTLQFVVDLAEGNHFYFGNSRIFERGSVRRKRIECVEVKTGKRYLFQPNARVLATEKHE